MLRGFFGNLIFAIIARMLCGNHLNNHYCLFYWKILFLFERLEDKIKDIWKILQAFPISNHSHLEISQFMIGINGHSLIERGTRTWPTIVSVSIYWEGNRNWEKPDLSFCQEKKESSHNNYFQRKQANLECKYQCDQAFNNQENNN